MVWAAHPSLSGCQLERLRLEAPLPRWGSQGPTPLDPHAESLLQGLPTWLGFFRLVHLRAGELPTHQLVSPERAFC